MEGTLPINIAYFIASPTWGGGEQYVFDLACHMKAQYNVCPYFIFPPQSDPSMTARFEQIGECLIFPYVGKGWRFLPYAGRQLEKILYQWHIDILHINSRQTYFTAVWAKRCARQPFRLIATQHLVRPAKNGLMWRWVYKQIDTLTCVSQFVRRVYLQKLDAHTFPDVRVIHNSAPIRMSDAAHTKQSPMTHILYHGRICKEKGIEPLFKALDLIADLPFTITFSGNIEQRDRDSWDHLLASSLVRDKIRYVGFNSDMRHLLSECHIGVSPSIVREAGPLSMIEQMAFGLAVVTSDNGSQPEFIRNGENGMLCPPDDPQALAAILRRLLTDSGLTHRLGQQAQSDFFAAHSYDQFIQKMYHLYSL